MTTRPRGLAAALLAASAVATGLAGLPAAPAAAATATFTNNVTTSIPEYGVASPYPSTITVSGLAGQVDEVTATLTGVSHPYVRDLDVLLVGPTGAAVLLMSDLGGEDLWVSNGTFTFDDDATTPFQYFPADGTYRPTNVWEPSVPDFFPAPAPGSYGTTLGVFDGLDPNGLWQLFVFDDFSPDAGSIAAWSLTISTTDAAPPEIAINSPADGGQHLIGSTVLADYSCTDDVAVATCAGPVADGAPIDTATVGAHAFTVDASDTGGNTSQKTHNYEVVWPFNGFFQPVDNPGPHNDVYNAVKAGATVPVRFSLGGNRGLAIVGASSSKRIECDGTATTDPLEETTAPGSSALSYDAATDQYQFNWKTAKEWAGTCRVLTVELADGTSHHALFSFKK